MADIAGLNSMQGIKAIRQAREATDKEARCLKVDNSFNVESLAGEGSQMASQTRHGH